MYPVELEIKDTTEGNTSASYLDLRLSIGRDGHFHTFIYDKYDDFNFHITNFPFLSNNIPASSAYGVFIYKKRLLLRCIHHFNSDLIKYMDYMHFVYWILVSDP